MNILYIRRRWKIQRKNPIDYDVYHEFNELSIETASLGVN